MKIFIFLFIFICTIYSQNSEYYWDDVGITLQQLLVKMDTPDGIEYQPSGIYLFAYDFGDVVVIYIVDKGFVSSVLYMKNSKNPKDINNALLEMHEISSFYGFSTYKFTGNHIEKYRDGIEMIGNITILKTEFVLTILVTKIKK